MLNRNEGVDWVRGGRGGDRLDCGVGMGSLEERREGNLAIKLNKNKVVDRVRFIWTIIPLLLGRIGVVNTKEMPNSWMLKSLI